MARFNSRWMDVVLCDPIGVAAAWRDETEEPGKSVTERVRTGNTVTIRTTRTNDVSVFKVIDESGVERIYHSLEEMPPEICAAIAEALRSK